ncbi:MAG: lipoprotein signal peptidase [Prevotella sp.]|uniref:lipoprotein signal peptidase n=1 Tax=Prevotella sp. AGR2160 TaxID=1280674 RepID=UPI0004119FD4|nr:lipoprotein signal peptidase [Prevotella sp. AGR2160]MDD5863005.1 lipoprotein signal peptidase [Prevotella sp.]
MQYNQKKVRVLSVALIVLVLAIDQIIKIWVKTHMTLGQQYEIAPWFRICFIENNGMAWGMTFFNKYVLSIFRIIAVAIIGWYIHKQISRGARLRYVFLLSLILAGAAGNIFDSMFYGLIFTASSPDYVAWLVPFGQGYAGFLTGKVVDMFYFPLIDTYLPTWLPLVGGSHFTFFDPVFNFADSAISVGVIALLLFCRKDMEPKQKESKASEDHVSASEKVSDQKGGAA